MQIHQDEEFTCVKNSKSFRFQDPSAKNCVFFYLSHNHDFYLTASELNPSRGKIRKIDDTAFVKGM